MKIVNFECNAPLDRNLIDSILNVCNALNANDRIYLHGNAISEISPRHQVQKLPVQLSGILSAISRKGFAFRTLGRECVGGIFIAKKFSRAKRVTQHQVESAHFEALRADYLGNMYKNFWSMRREDRRAWFDEDHETALKCNGDLERYMRVENLHHDQCIFFRMSPLRKEQEINCAHTEALKDNALHDRDLSAKVTSFYGEI